MKNPYEDKNGNPKEGHGIDWILWRKNDRASKNPFLDKDGGTMHGFHNEFLTYMLLSFELYEKDKKKLNEADRKFLKDREDFFRRRYESERAR